MGRKILVSLVSEQTLPNVMFINSCRKQYEEIDLYLFITTEGMEVEGKNRREWIIRATEIEEGKTSHIKVDSENYNKILEKLSELNFNENDEFIVNITGGTKIMTLACFNFFKDKNTKFWYKPIKSNKSFDLFNENTFIEHEALTIKEYLKACGLFEDFYTTSEPYSDYETANKFLKKYLEDNNNFHKKIEFIRVALRNNEKIDEKIWKKGKLFDSNSKELFEKECEKKKDELKNAHIMSFEETIEFLTNLREEKLLRPGNENGFSKNDIDYITGGWLEELVYYIILKHVGTENILLNTKITKNNNNFLDNEFDVLTVNKENLYTIECKTQIERSSYTSILYKVSALKQYFSLTTKPVLITTSEINDSKKAMAKTLNITLIDKDTFLKENFAEEIISKIFNF